MIFLLIALLQAIKFSSLMIFLRHLKPVKMTQKSSEKYYWISLFQLKMQPHSLQVYL